MKIEIKGASQNTLQNIDLSLPCGKLIALMGPSGSGKSTLAYDTLFAESRRRFLDCLSVGARRLLARPEKPHVQSIDGLPPALCLEQALPAGQSRNLLGNLTETLDYLRIIFAAIGVPHDPATGERLTRMSPGEIADALLELPERTRLTLLAPLRAEFASAPETRESDLLELQKLGYLRIRLRGEVLDMEELQAHPPQEGENCELVIDRIICKAGIESRLADSIQAALSIQPDELRVLAQLSESNDTRLLQFYTRYRNANSGFTLPDLSPTTFSHYSLAGACDTCAGLGLLEKKSSSKEQHWIICPACHGMRLNAIALAVTLNIAGQEWNIAQLSQQSVEALAEMCTQIDIPSLYADALSVPLFELKKRLQCLLDLGLGYLSLHRPTNTLSGGELQRARLAGQIGGGLSGVLYILDEPTIGLHPRETDKLIIALQGLRDKGNTVLVVEHDPQLLAACDYLIEMGPGSGPQGGQIMAQGTYSDFLNPQIIQSPTAQWLQGVKQLAQSEPCELGRATWACLKGKLATARNLKGDDFSFPLRAFVCLSGPSGSGKSTLVHECLLPALKAGKVEGVQGEIARAVLVDQKLPSTKSGQRAISSPATLTGLLDVLRPLFAALPLSKQRGYKAARFSLATRGGRCERCGGSGQLQIDMNFLANLSTPCDACKGLRYNRETLEVTWRGKSIAAVLAMSAQEALGFLENIPAAANILRAMCDLGLAYLSLDRPAATLSGGEAQRIKLATYLAKAAPKRGGRAGAPGSIGERLLLVLDEPSTGLHFGELDLLLRALYRLRDAGHSILCIEHNQEILARADYLIEMGPNSGAQGGHILAPALK